MLWSCDVSAPWDYISFAVYPSNQSISCAKLQNDFSSIYTIYLWDEIFMMNFEDLVKIKREFIIIITLQHELQ